MSLTTIINLATAIGLEMITLLIFALMSIIAAKIEISKETDETNRKAKDNNPPDRR